MPLPSNTGHYAESKTPTNHQPTNQVMEINKSNVLCLTYYNLLQLCRITGYANPIAGIMATGEAWECKADGNGNILSGRKA
jgi:hypothetical protein